MEIGQERVRNGEERIFLQGISLLCASDAGVKRVYFMSIALLTKESICETSSSSSFWLALSLSLASC